MLNRFDLAPAFKEIVGDLRLSHMHQKGKSRSFAEGQRENVLEGMRKTNVDSHSSAGLCREMSTQDDAL